MNQVYDSLQRHMDDGLDMAQASIPMGMLLAWAVNLQLVDQRLYGEYEQLILRIRYGEISGSELLIAAGGDLRRDMFNAQGQRFLDQHYPAYLEAFTELIEAPVQDNQANYARVARWLTDRYMGAGKRQGLVSRLQRWWRNA